MRNAWVVVGDVVTSRRFVDEAALVRGLAACLEEVNAAVPGRRRLQVIADDTFEGTWDDLADMATATVRLRLVTDDLVLATVDGEDEPVDVRVGIAHGPVEADGTPSEAVLAAARDARARAQELPSRPKWPPSLRTVVAGEGDHPALLRAWFVLQDQLLARMDARDRRALLGLMDDERQVDIADALGVTQPAIARRVRDRGALAIMRALRVLDAATDDD